MLRSSALLTSKLKTPWTMLLIQTHFQPDSCHLLQYPQCPSLKLSKAFSVQSSKDRRTPDAESFDQNLLSLDYNIRKLGRISLEDTQEMKTATSSKSLMNIRCCGGLVPEKISENRPKLAHEVWQTMEKRMNVLIPFNSPKVPMGIPINYRIVPITYQDRPTRIERPMEDPLSISNHTVIEDAPDTTKTRIEKRAARLIVIRRIKMNRHKLKKLRKRMKQIWAKLKLRREIKKERLFLDDLLANVREAERFDPKEHVAMLIAKAKEKPLPLRYKGRRMPAWWIKEQIALGNIKL